MGGQLFFVNDRQKSYVALIRFQPCKYCIMNTNFLKIVNKINPYRAKNSYSFNFISAKSINFIVLNFSKRGMFLIN